MWMFHIQNVVIYTYRKRKYHNLVIIYYAVVYLLIQVKDIDCLSAFNRSEPDLIHQFNVCIKSFVCFLCFIVL